jgi:hypothetical protein
MPLPCSSYGSSRLSIDQPWCGAWGYVAAAGVYSIFLVDSGGLVINLVINR